ncbi:MAG: hypothetical protein E7390_04795 [Ruminococcaceae bacterium]|nr:hypothetical protein [Oscillospiraceae bacterium]
MSEKNLADREYPDILTMQDNSVVTPENWRKRRQELISLLETYSYGKTPRIPVKVRGEVSVLDTAAYGGKIRNEKVTVFIETERGGFSFPVEFFIPRNAEKPPVFLHLAFKPAPDKFIPVEEITDAGYALAVLVYTDVVNDNHYGDYSDGLAAYFGTDRDRREDEWGKIGMWAYAASRVLDYMINERDDVDTSKVAVIGHSRLGKTALWCGAQDERFAAVISNNSGYGGAASSKHGSGERVTDFIRVGSWDWFCENFQKFSGSLEDEKPYDQSFLLALVAPRLLCVGSAVLDRGADPESEFFTALHASSAWELLGKKGLVCPDRKPVPGDHFAEGNIGYHLRENGHFLSREDWGAYIKFLDGKGF